MAAHGGVHGGRARRRRRRQANCAAATRDARDDAWRCAARGARRGAHVDPLAVDVDRLVERRDLLRVLRLAGAARDRAQLVLAVELHAARVAAAAEGAAEDGGHLRLRLLRRRFGLLPLAHRARCERCCVRREPESAAAARRFTPACRASSHASDLGLTIADAADSTAARHLRRNNAPLRRRQGAPLRLVAEPDRHSKRPVPRGAGLFCGC